MTGDTPSGFVNYPDEPDPDASRYCEPELSHAPASPAGPAPGHGRTSRRGLLAALAVAPLGVLIAGASTWRLWGSAPDRSSGRVATAGASPSQATQRMRVNVAGNRAWVPAGWTVDENGANLAILSAGANWVLAYAFVADRDDRPEDLLAPLTKEHLGAFVGSLGTPDPDVNEEWASRALLKAEGTAQGLPAKLRSQLWINEFLDALLVIQTLTTSFGTTVDQQADLLVLEFTADFR